MRKFLLSALVCAIGTLPVTVYGEDRVLTVQFPDSPRSKAIDSEEILAIETGIAIGGATGYFLLPFRVASVFGAIAGGLIGDWWYKREFDNYQPLERRKAFR
jgi:hypothetical protein